MNREGFSWAVVLGRPGLVSTSSSDKRSSEHVRLAARLEVWCRLHMMSPWHIVHSPSLGNCFWR